MKVTRTITSTYAILLLLLCAASVLAVRLLSASWQPKESGHAMQGNMGKGTTSNSTKDDDTFESAPSITVNVSPPEELQRADTEFTQEEIRRRSGAIARFSGKPVDESLFAVKLYSNQDRNLRYFRVSSFTSSTLILDFDARTGELIGLLNDEFEPKIEMDAAQLTIESVTQLAQEFFAAAGNKEENGKLQVEPYTCGESTNCCGMRPCEVWIVTDASNQISKVGVLAVCMRNAVILRYSKLVTSAPELFKSSAFARPR